MMNRVKVAVIVAAGAVTAFLTMATGGCAPGDGRPPGRGSRRSAAC